MHLPIIEEDLGHGTQYGIEEEGGDHGGRFSFLKLFFTILVSAPLATALALAVTDYYNDIMMRDKAELKVPVTATVAAPVVAPRGTSGISSAEFNKMVKAIEKSNRLIASAIEKQSKSNKKEMETLAKIAGRKPTVVKVVSQVGGGKARMPSIVVVRVPSKGKFDLDYELERILQLSEVDLDDPNISAEDFDHITSKPVLKEIIRALEYLIASARTHPEIGDTLKNHAIKAKKYARARLGKL